MSPETLKQDKELWQLRSEIFPLILDSPRLDLLIIVKKILKNADQIKTIDNPSSEIIGTNPDGTPLTKEEEEKDLWEAIRQAENGEVISLEDAIAESKTWLK